jgi:hypothetical protein
MVEWVHDRRCLADGPYTDRITTFIDILGFTLDVASLPARPALLLSIVGGGSAVPGE